MKNKCFYFIALVLFLWNDNLHAQKQGNIWIFSDSCGINFNNNETNAFSINNSFTSVGSIECLATIADTSGQLLYYFYPTEQEVTGGYNFKFGKIYNKDNQIIENGDEIYTSFTITNGAVFLPMPGNDRYTYLFTLGPLQNWSYLPPPPNCCRYALLYHIIDNNANNGKGKIIDKNKILYEENINQYYTAVLGIEEKLSITRHTNGRDWWIFIFDRKNCQFVRFLLNPTGISAPQTQFILPCPEDSSYWTAVGAGEMVFSPQGNRLVYTAQLPSNFSQLATFDFDRCTGLLSNPKKLFVPLMQSPYNDEVYSYSYGTAYSSDESKLYVTTARRLYQFDFNAPDINQSIYVVHEITDNNNLGQLENGVDGKIYLTKFTYNKYLDVIHSPNDSGASCNFEVNGFSLNGHKIEVGLPNMPNYQLEALYPPPPIEAGNDTTICPGGTALLGTPAAPGLLYRWRPGDSVLDSTAAQTTAKPDVTTTYTLAVAYTSASACFVNFDALTVNVTHFPTAIIAEPDTFSGPPFTVHFKTEGADTSGLLFNWDFGDQQTGTGATTSHTYDAIDGYPVRLYMQDSSGNCKDTIAYNLKLTLITGVNEVQTKQNSFKLYPNPADETVTIEHNYENATVEIFTPLGKIVHTQNAPKPKTNIDLRRLAKGIYYLKLYTNLNQFLAII